MKMPRSESASRRPYRSPRLTVFGGVAELTRGGAKTTKSDHGNNAMWPS